MTSEESVLVAEDVTVTYSVYEDNRRGTLKSAVAGRFRRAKPRRIEAVRGVSFELREREALGLIGLNGSGKSSLLRALAGLMPMSSGRVLARAEPVLLGVGAVLHPELSGRRNIYLGGTAMGMSRVEVEQKFQSIVDFAGVGEYIDMPFRTFSSGMNSRLRFAIAAALEPDILLVDEALAVGDTAFRIKSEARMRELIAKAGALVLVSHSAQSIADLCTRVIWLDSGQVKADGPTQAVLAEYDAFARSR